MNANNIGILKEDDDSSNKLIIQSIMLAVMLADEPSLSSINPFCRPPSLPSPLFVAFPISIHLMLWFGIELERAIQYANGGNIILMIT